MSSSTWVGDYSLSGQTPLNSLRITVSGRFGVEGSLPQRAA